MPAGADDLETASSILVEAAEWLIARGAPLWNPVDLAPARLRAECDAGALYLGRLAVPRAAEPVATIALRFEDRIFWPDAASGEAGFVHRLAVRRRVAGSGVALALIEWAERSARTRGCRFLRLDCSAAHPGLVRYYETAGFVRHSEGSLGSYRFVRFQKLLLPALEREPALGQR